MKILGIDPGLRATGYGIIECQNQSIKLLETGTIQPLAKDPFEKRIEKIFRNLDEIVGLYKPDVLVLEKLYAHYKHPFTASILGHVRGVVCLLCAQRNIRLEEQSVKRIRKSLTGNGNASKQQTQRMVVHTLNIDTAKLTLDASDALALALGYMYIHRSL